MSKVDLPPVLPRSVTVRFPQVADGLPFTHYALEVLFEDLDLPDLAGTPRHQGSHNLHASLTALGEDEPENLEDLTAYAEQAATDYYRWNAGGWLDEVFGGCEPWEPEGLHEIEWTYQLGHASTRVQRAPRTGEVSELRSGDSGGGDVIYGPITYKGDVYFGDDVTFAGDVTFTGDISFSGSVIFIDVTITNSLLVLNALLVNQLLINLYLPTFVYNDFTIIDIDVDIFKVTKFNVEVFVDLTVIINSVLKFEVTEFHLWAFGVFVVTADFVNVFAPFLIQLGGRPHFQVDLGLVTVHEDMIAKCCFTMAGCWIGKLWETEAGVDDNVDIPAKLVNAASATCGITVLEIFSGTDELHGIQATDTGQLLFVINGGAGDLDVIHASPSTTAGYSILLPHSRDTTLNPNVGMLLYYHPGLSKWVTISAPEPKGVDDVLTVVTAVSCNAGTLSVTTEQWTFEGGRLTDVT